ncbi:MAG: hypothetical protein KDD69_20220, partial [Bdellovibrionales bacterium]|nr:hypothetical protein [Bdellovibrionales bacterium]
MNSEAPGQHRDERRSEGLATTCRYVVGAGLAAVPLLPIGLWTLSGWMFQAVWAVHVLLQGAALVVAGRYLLACCRSLGRRSLWYAFPAAVFVLLLVLFSALPVTARDALIYHLAVPKLWIAEGR